MNQNKILSFLEGYVLALLFFIQASYSITEIWSKKNLDLIFFLNNFVRPLAFSIILFKSSRKVDKTVNLKIAMGVALSYIPFLFFTNQPIQWSPLVYTSLYISNLFYLLLLFISVFQMRNHFTVLPGFKRLVFGGLYSMIRHPIYSSYIHLALINLIVSPTFPNTVLSVFVFIGLRIRASEEEKVLSKNEAEYFRKMPTSRFFHWLISMPLLASFALCCFNFPQNEKKSLVIDLAYPIYSLDPTVADDWSSFLVINHIYPRFNSRPGADRSLRIFNKMNVFCKENYPVYSSECKTVQVHFHLNKNLKSCTGKDYLLSDFKYELSRIVTRKNWIFPNFKFCGDTCIEFSQVSNIQNHFDSIYLRFGWSIQENKNLGIKPNCFKPTKSSKNLITEGEITSPDKSVTLKTNIRDADIVLYGNRPQNKEYRTLNFYNPIYFYLVSRSSISKNTLNLISDHLLRKRVISTAKPEGLAIANESRLKIKIPDYLPGCALLAKELAQKTIHSYECINISLFTEEVVKGGKPFDGFISPLTPGMPGKDGVKKQYFDLNSNDNWLGNSTNTRVYLIGISDGVIQVKKDKICSIRPNSLGLSDITIHDFVEC